MNPQTISTQLLTPRLGAVGHIKIGRLGPERTSGGGKTFRIPEKLDHFRVTTRERGPDGNLIRDDAIHAEVGDEPTELDFVLPFDEVAQNFRARMTEYEGQTCKISCDGEQFENRLTGVEGTCVRRQGQRCKCKPNGALTVLLEAGRTFGGVHVFRSTSWETVANIQTTLRMFREQFGSLRGLPLRLKMYPAEVQYEQGGQTKTGTAWKVTVELRASFEEAARIALDYHRTAQLAKREILQLAAGLDSDLRQMERDEEPHIAAEFFPESGGQPVQRIGALNRALAAPAAPEPQDDALGGVEVEDDDVFGALNLRLNLAIDAGVLTRRQVESTRQIVEAREDHERARTAIDWLQGLLDAEEG